MMEKQRVRFSRKHVFEHNDSFDVMHWQYKVQVEAVVFMLSSHLAEPGIQKPA